MDEFVTSRLKQITQIQLEIANYRTTCAHKDVQLKPWRGGEFDNEFYYTITCNDCGLTWVEEQSIYDKHKRKQ